MKKTFITTVAVLLGMAAAAQDSIPYLSVFGQETSSWHIARFIRSVDQGGASTAVLTSFTDSSLQTAAWHPVLLGSDTALSLMESSDHSRLFLRYPSDTTAHLLMDLNLQSGDTLPVHFRNGSDTLAIVDSVYYLDSLKHLRTTLALSFSGYVGVRTPDDTTLGNIPSEVSVPLTLIEGIGPNWGLDYGRESLDSILAVSPLLLCHFRDSAIDYHQQVDSDYPRPDGSDNDPCSLEYIRYKSVFGKEESTWYTVWTIPMNDAGYAYTTILNFSSNPSTDETSWHPITKEGDTILYLRETHDHSKLYARAYGDSSDFLVMNVNVHQGDTFVFHQPYNDITCTIDSIYFINGVKYINTDIFDWYPDYALHDCDYTHVPLVFIEGVGPRCGLEHLILEYIIWKGYYMNMPMLICYYKDNHREYHNEKVTTNNPMDTTCTVNYSWHSITTTMNNTIAIFPNPVADYLTIDNLPQVPKTIMLQDIYGRKWITFNNSEESMTIDLSHLPRQIYFLSVLHESGVFTQKIIKQ